MKIPSDILLRKGMLAKENALISICGTKTGRFSGKKINISTTPREDVSPSKRVSGPSVRITTKVNTVLWVNFKYLRGLKFNVVDN